MLESLFLTGNVFDVTSALEIAKKDPQLLFNLKVQLNFDFDKVVNF